MELDRANTGRSVRPSANLAKTIAVVRIATAVFFILFGQYKLFGSGFAHGGFQQYLRGYIDSTAVSFYRPDSRQPRAPVMPYSSDTWSAQSKCLSGCRCCWEYGSGAASVLGALHMLSLTLATWWDPGHGVPVWRYFGNELDHLPVLFLFIIFFVSDAGRQWGLDGRRQE